MTDRRSGDDLVKITFALDDEDAWHQHDFEHLWADDLGNEHFRVRNVPFYKYGVSFGDTVVAERRDDDLLAREIVERGGHSTYRIFLEEQFTPDSTEFARYWGPIEAAGANYERGNDMIVAVDVPASADIDRVYNLLQKGEDDGIWAFEEGHCGHPDPGEEKEGT